MAAFPKLTTGVVAQYPVAREVEFATQVQQYVDLSEQRHRDHKTNQRHWLIELSQLTDAELAGLVNFFREHRGRFGSFDFEDPWSGSIISGCRFEQDSLRIAMNGEANSSMRLTIVGPLTT